MTESRRAKPKAVKAESVPSGQRVAPKPVTSDPVVPNADPVLAGMTLAAGLIAQAIRWAGIIWLGSYVVQALTVLAGKQTQAAFLLSVMSNGSVQNIVCALFGTGGVGYGLFTRHTYKKRISGLSKQLTTLEAHLDPNRSSSGLTEMGDGLKM